MRAGPEDAPAPRDACRRRLSLDPDVAEALIVLDRMRDEPVDVRPHDRDLSRGVPGHEHDIARDHVLRTAVELLPLARVKVGARRVYQLVGLRINVPPGVPAL